MTTSVLSTLREATAGSNFGYHGEHFDWLLAASTHRDADTLTRANYSATLRLVSRADSEGEDYVEETASHWAVGWVGYLLVRPDTAAAEVAQEIADKLEDYPVVEEEELSLVEDEEACATASVALSDYGYTRTDSEEAGYFVVRAADDDRTGPGYCGVENWYPSRTIVFRGVLAYRRWLRTQNQQNQENQNVEVK